MLCSQSKLNQDFTEIDSEIFILEAAMTRNNVFSFMRCFNFFPQNVFAKYLLINSSKKRRLVAVFFHLM